MLDLRPHRRGENIVLDILNEKLHAIDVGIGDGRLLGSKGTHKEDKLEPTRLFFGGNVYTNSGPLVERRFDQEFVTQQRVHRMVLPDLEQKFTAILTGRGWQRLPELAPGIPYPGIEEWVTLQISSGHGVKFYPCFIHDQQGITRFLKVQVTRKNGRFGVETDRIIVKEARILQSGLLPISTPAYVDHGEGGENTLAFLCVEAINVEDGQVRSGSEWSPDISNSAAAQIHILERIPLKRLDTIFTEEESQGAGGSANVANLIKRAGAHLDADLRADILTLAGGVPPPNVFTHGDLTLDNIIVCADGDTEFIDWETAAVGFLGRDASKLLAGLSENPAARSAFIRAYVAEDDGTLDRQRLRCLYLGKVAENLNHLVWRLERMTPALESKYPGIRSQIQEFHTNIRQDVSEYRDQLHLYSGTRTRPYA